MVVSKIWGPHSSTPNSRILLTRTPNKIPWTPNPKPSKPEPERELHLPKLEGAWASSSWHTNSRTGLAFRSARYDVAGLKGREAARLHLWVRVVRVPAPGFLTAFASLVSECRRCVGWISTRHLILCTEAPASYVLQHIHIHLYIYIYMYTYIYIYLYIYIYIFCMRISIYLSVYLSAHMHLRVSPEYDITNVSLWQSHPQWFCVSCTRGTQTYADCHSHVALPLSTFYISMPISVAFFPSPTACRSPLLLPPPLVEPGAKLPAAI